MTSRDGWNADAMVQRISGERFASAGAESDAPAARSPARVKNSRLEWGIINPVPVTQFRAISTRGFGAMALGRTGRVSVPAQPSPSSLDFRVENRCGPATAAWFAQNSDRKRLRDPSTNE